MTTFRLPRQFQHTRCLHFPSRSTSKVCVKSLCDYANSLPCSARYIYIYIYAQVPRAVVVVVVGTVAAVYRVCVCFDCTDRQTPDHLTICGNRVFDFTAKEMQSPLTFPAHRRPTQPGAPKPHFGYVCLSRWLS